MEYDDVKERAVREALASAQMEGLPVTPEIEKKVRRLIDGEFTVEERIRQIKAGHGNR